MARADKSVDIAIRARDEYSKVLKKAEGDLKGLDAARARYEGRKSLLTDSKGSIAETRKELRKAREEATALGKALNGTDGGNTGYKGFSNAKQFADAKARVAELETALQGYAKQLDVVRNKEVASFASFSKSASALEEKAAATREAEAASRAAAAAEQQQAAATRKAAMAEKARAANARATAAATKNQSTVTRELTRNLTEMEAAELKAAETRRRAAASAAMARSRTQTILAGGPKRRGIADRITDAWSTPDGRGPLGLRPYELTNLSYQINDVASGLAMGQPPMQVFAQQAGQIAQIFPNLIKGFLNLTPVIAVLTPFAVALARVNKEANLLKDLDLKFAIDVDGGDVDTRDLQRMIIMADRAGLSFEEAKKSVLSFSEAGFENSQIPGLIDMAQRLARVTGTDVPTAVEQLVKGFSNGVDGVVELDDSLNFLTASQYENIRALQDQGKEAEAVAVAMKAFEASVADVSAKSDGEWATAARNLGQAWNDFIDYLSQTAAIEGTIELLNDFAKGVSTLARVLNRSKGLSGSEGIAESLAGISDGDLASRRASAESQLRNAQSAQQGSLTNSALNVFGKEWRGLANSVNDAQELVILLDAVAALPEDMRTMENVLELAVAIENGESLRDAIENVGAALEDQTGAAEGVTEASEKSKKEAIDIQRAVDETVDGMTEEARLANLTARERFIETKTLELRNKLLKEGKDLTLEQLNAIREGAAALFDAQNPLDAAAYEAQFTATRFSPKGEQMGEIVRAATLMAQELGLKVEDVLTAISYETAGTFDPWKAGPTTQWGQHRGLIQWGEPQRAQYGVSENSTIGQQMAAVGKYLTDAGVKAGDGLLQIYAAINAGDARKVNASDANNGGAPGTVLDKVQNQMSGHKAKAQGLVAAYGSTVETAEGDFKAQEKADEFHSDMAERLAMQQQENALIDEGIIARETAKALAQAEMAAKKAGTELTAQERDLIKETIAAKYSKAAADEQEKARLQEGKQLQEQVNMLMERRKFLQDQMNQAVQMGDRSKAAQLAEELQTVNGELDQAIAKATAFWSSMSGTDAEMAVQKLQQTKVGLQETGRQSAITADSINNLFVGAISNGFSVYARSLAEGKTQAESLKAAFAQTASDILIQLGQMIMKQMLFNMISGMMGGGGGGGLGGAIAGVINGAILHTGGTPGTATRSRNIPAAMVASAPRFHNGTPGNLKANEVVTVLEKDEEVLTSKDPRHKDNMSMGLGLSGGIGSMMENVGSGGVLPALLGGKNPLGVFGGGEGGNSKPATIVNAIDSESMLETALSSSRGGDVLLNFVRDRRDEIKAELE